MIATLEDDDEEDEKVTIEIVAMPHINEGNDIGSDSLEEIEEPDGLDLPTVDIWESPGVYVVIDDGCNRNVHSQAWAENAEAKLARLGYHSPWTSRTP